MGTRVKEIREIVFSSIRQVVSYARERGIERGDIVGIYPDGVGGYHLVYYGED